LPHLPQSNLKIFLEAQSPSIEFDATLLEFDATRIEFNSNKNAIFYIKEINLHQRTMNALKPLQLDIYHNLYVSISLSS
jgi:hypothetical protein